jgi:hypothetical protein
MKMGGMVYPLADALQMNLAVMDKGGVVSIVLPENPNKRIHLIGAEIPFPLECTLKGSYVGPYSANLILRVMGDLHLVMAYSSTIKLLTAVVLDANILPLTPKTMERINGHALPEILDVVEEAVVAIYTCKYQETTWREEKKDAYILDNRHTGGIVESSGGKAKGSVRAGS